MVLHGKDQTLPLARWIFALKKRLIASTFASRLMHVLLLSKQKNPPVEAIFGIVMMLSHRCPFAWLPPIKLARDVLCPQWLRPLGLATQLAGNVLCPCWPRLLGLAVKRSSPTMTRALVDQDHWGLLYIMLAHPRCQSPCGGTAIWLAVKRLVSRPWSRAFWPWPLLACFSIVV